MADRESRFQMRQRGAGARNVDDFSFNIGTASSDRATTPDNVSTRGAPVQSLVVGDDVARQQRFLMRQRGAGARDVDFTLDLGVPVASSPTGRVSVAESTESASSNTRPEPQNGAVTVAPSSLRRSFLAPVAQMAAIDNDGAITKRRRLSPEIEEEVAGEALFFDDDDTRESPEERIPSSVVAVSASSPAAGSTGSNKRRKKKKSVLRKPKKRKATNSGSSVASSVIAEEDAGAVRQALTKNHNPQQSIQATLERSPSLEDADGEAEEVVGQLNTESNRNREPTGSSEQPKLYNIFNRANRPAALSAIPAVQRILNEHGINNKENRPLNISTKPKTATRATKQVKASSKKTASKRKESKSRTTHGLQEENNQVIVTVHRVANLSQLNFRIGEDDELITEQVPPIRQKKSPNGIDVLAQICREIIDKRVKALSTDPRLEQDGQKNILKRQIETFRRFGEELASRLLMMTTALDHNISLTHNLKEATRLKAQHRTDLLDLRKQRQDIELQQDAIRATNEAETTQAAERFELNTLLGDIQLAVQRGRDSTDVDADSVSENPRESLAMRLQRASEVVGPAAKKNLLMRVREVNSLLEGLLEKGV